MSYQVLARKYRPTSFQDLEGQEHVLQALVNALDNERLHHAYLFTGTRGVGKTTIARILARCLNCESGVTSTPCGKCNTCLEISEGRSVDLIEVDAASRTGVDDMREMLDNVQYMPTVSRFKIYLIDEVHMLSRSSFNAMLKTLEEPPAHVKFLFATTDPKKLPVTVLSRCLQFNLKNLSPEQIVHHLGVVLDKESIDYDESALWQLGHAADGSMRDGLSLTDQAISFGNNEVRDGPVKAMLGSIDHQEVYDLIDAVIAEDGARLLEKIRVLSEFAPDYAALLDNILSVLHRIAIAHAVPGAVDNSQGDRELVLAAAGRVSAEQVQLLYQIGLIGQRDLPLAPMPRIGFEMVMLRMLSFTPEVSSPESTAPTGAGGTTRPAGSGSAAAKPAKTSPIAGLLSAINGEAPSQEDTSQAGASQKAAPQSDQVSSTFSATTSATTASQELKTAGSRDEPTAGSVGEPQKKSPLKPVAPQKQSQPADQEAEEKSTDVPVPDFIPDNWSLILDCLGLTGVTRNLATNCLLEVAEPGRCVLKLAEHHASLWNKAVEQRIGNALSQLYKQDIKVAIEVGTTNAETPAQRAERERQASLAQAVADLQGDLHVQQLIKNFNGKLDPESITPLGG